MRNLSPTERAYLTDPEGHWVFAYLEVTNFDGTWINVGNVAVGARNVDFLNTMTWGDHIDANTLSMSATLLREVGAYSLVPFRTDSPLNVDDSGVDYSPLLDLHRLWRLNGVVLARGSFPSSPSDYREWATGIVDRIDIQGDPATIGVQGRGLEADIIDARIIDVPKSYAADTLGPFIQSVLDGQHGAGVIPLTVDGSAPAFFVNQLDLPADGDIGEMDLITQTASLPGASLRYLYDASDVLSFTLYAVNRTPSTPDWTTDGGEYETLDAGIALGPIINYVVVRYFDTAFQSVQVVTSPATPTSASITRFGLRTMVIDLSATTGITNDTDAGVFADAIRSDLEFPVIEHQLTGRGFWFAGLGDWVQLVANGIHYTDDQFGGVTSYQHTFANGELKSTLGLRGNPAGRYRTWLTVPSAPRNRLLPEMASLTLAFEDDGVFGALDVVFVFGNLAKSAKLELDDDPAFGSIWQTVQFDPLVSGTETRQSFGFPDATYRNKRWYARVTPYSGPYSGGVTGIPGIALTANTWAGFQVPTKPAFDVVVADVATINTSLATLAAIDFIVKTASGALSAERVATDSSDIVFDWSVAGQVAPRFAQDMATQAELDAAIFSSRLISAALGTITVKEVFINIAEDSTGLHTLLCSTIPASEVELNTAYRRQRLLTGLGSVRLNANIKSLTGTPSIRLKFTIDGFVSVTNILTWTPLATGVSSSAPVALPAGSNVDVGLTIYLADGAGTASLELWELDAEFVPAIVASTRIHTPAFAAAYV